MSAGAPTGNKNAAKGRLFEGALKRAIAQDDGKKLRRIAEKLIDLAEEGEAWAVRELADRLDGKAQQGIVLSQDEENPLFDTLKNSEDLRKKLRGAAPAIIKHVEQQESGIAQQDNPQYQNIERTEPE